MFPYFRVIGFLIIQSNIAFADKDLILIPKFSEGYTYSEKHDAFFKLLPGKFSWFDAFTACTSEHSRLAFPRTVEEASYIRKLLKTPQAESNTTLWVGASKINLDGVFKTVEGETLSKTHFPKLENERTGADADECVVMRRNQQFYKKSCFLKRRAICKKIRPADPCPSLCIAPGYASDPDRSSCYKVHTDLKSWMDANIFCEREDAHLLVLNSQREANYLTILLDNNNTQTNNLEKHLVGVGFNDMDNEGVYVTVDGQMLNETGYSLWKQFEPSGKDRKGKDATEEDCGSMIRDNALLNDINCDTPLAFVCEREIRLPIWD